MPEYHVGQTVFVVPRDRYGDPFETTIEKIGRKWVQCGWRCTFDKNTGEGKPAPGYSPTYQIYPSREDWERKAGRQRAWSDLMVKMRTQYGVPKHLTTAEIKEIDAQIFQGE